MPTRTSATVGAPTWIDLSTSDPAAARAFYGELFGWTADEPNPEFGGYFMFSHAGAYVAGCMDNAHDPDRTDQQLDEIGERARARLARASAGGRDGVACDVAREGMTILL